MDWVLIIGYLLYVVLLFLALTWMFGVRVTPAPMYPTILGSFYFTILAITFPFLSDNFLHLLWLIPLGFIVSFVSNIIFIPRLVLLDPLLRGILNVYSGILKLGLRSK